MTVPPPFATTPPAGLPDLIEHDACALAAFATRDGKPSRRMVEHRPDVAPDDGPPLRERGRRGRRERAAGRPPPAAVAPAAGGARASTRPRPTTRASRSPTSSSTRTEDAEAQVPRIEEIVREHGFEVLWSGEGTVDRSALGPRASETPPIFWQIACLACEPGARGVDQLLPGDGLRSSATSTCHVASFSANDAVYKVQGQPEVIPRFYPEMAEERLRLVADHRPQPLLDEHVPHVQPGAAVLDPRPQRRDQHDRPAPRAERAARPADLAPRLRQPGPQPPARGPHLREGALPARGRRVRPPADPRRGAPPAGEAPGPLRPLPRGARPVRAGPRRPGLPGERRDGLRGRRDGPAPAVVDRDRATCTSSRPSRGSSRCPS